MPRTILRGRIEQLALLLLILCVITACTSIPPPYVSEPAASIPPWTLSDALASEGTFFNEPQFGFLVSYPLADQTRVFASALKSAGVIDNFSFSDNENTKLGFNLQISISDSDYGDTSPEAVQWATLGLSGMWATNYQYFEFMASLAVSSCGKYLRTYYAVTRVDSRFRPGFWNFSTEQSVKWHEDIIDLGAKDLAKKLAGEVVKDSTWLSGHINDEYECGSVKNDASDAAALED